MQIIPAINCSDFNCVEEKFKKAADFGAEWVQIDIADGEFTAYRTWNQPKELLNYLQSTIYNLKSKIEIHLMVENPLEVVDDWIKAGARRIIIHLEALENDVNLRMRADVANNIEIGLAINPDTSVEKLKNFLKSPAKSRFAFIQILAVNPGLSGQKFDERVLEKIKFLKKNFSDVIIEVDGGINLETAKMCKEAGVDILVAGSYIWNSKNSQEAFQRLQQV